MGKTNLSRLGLSKGPDRKIFCSPSWGRHFEVLSLALQQLSAARDTAQETTALSYLYTHRVTSSLRNYLYLISNILCDEQTNAGKEIENDHNSLQWFVCVVFPGGGGT